MQIVVVFVSLVRIGLGGVVETERIFVFASFPMDHVAALDVFSLIPWSSLAIVGSAFERLVVGFRIFAFYFPFAHVGLFNLVLFLLFPAFGLPLSKTRIGLIVLLGDHPIVSVDFGNKLIDRLCSSLGPQNLKRLLFLRL